MSKSGKAKTAKDAQRQAAAPKPTHETVLIIGPTGKRRLERRPVNGQG